MFVRTLKKIRDLSIFLICSPSRRICSCPVQTANKCSGRTRSFVRVRPEQKIVVWQVLLVDLSDLFAEQTDLFVSCPDGEQMFGSNTIFCSCSPRTKDRRLAPALAN